MSGKVYQLDKNKMESSGERGDEKYQKPVLGDDIDGQLWAVNTFISMLLIRSREVQRVSESDETTCSTCWERPNRFLGLRSLHLHHLIRGLSSFGNQPSSHQDHPSQE